MGQDSTLKAYASQALEPIQVERRKCVKSQVSSARRTTWTVHEDLLPLFALPIRFALRPHRIRYSRRFGEFLWYSATSQSARRNLPKPTGSHQPPKARFTESAHGISISSWCTRCVHRSGPSLALVMRILIHGLQCPSWIYSYIKIKPS
jgi:hypothetical protein